MQAARFYANGRQLRIEETPKPTVRPGTGDVLVKVAGAGVCRTDLHILDGYFDAMIDRIPFTLGHESVGFVEELEQSSSEIREGMPVIVYPQLTCGLCHACRSGDDMRCIKGRFHGLDGTDGGFASYMKTDIRCLIPLSTSYGIEELAPLADAGLTVYHAIRRIVPALGHSRSVAVLGAGGLGQIAIQLLRVMTPAQILVVDVAEPKLKTAQELGADRTYLSAGAGKDSASGILEELRKEKINAVLDFVGETETVKLALSVLEKGGSYGIVGYGGRLDTDTMSLVASEFKIFGSLVGTYAELAELVEIWLRRKMKITINRYPLSRIEEALSDLRSGKTSGRCVVVP
jgi:D-arabinose 1-dehydrogenase-like Zn-dependent alcohol dehydrogenase